VGWFAHRAIVLCLLTGMALVGAGVSSAALAQAAVTPGALSQLPSPANCVTEEEHAAPAPACGTLVAKEAMSFSYQAQVSPDGKNVYSVAVNGALIEYARNLADGALTVIGCVSGTNKVCAINSTLEAPAMTAPAAVAISPDGSSVYVVTQGTDNAVVELSRNSETGLLSEIGCISHEASSPCATKEAKGLNVPYGVTVSADGKNVYVTGYADEAVAEFARNTETGELTQLAAPNDCISSTASSGCGTTSAIGLESAVGVAVSTDGENVYVAAGAQSGGDVAVFEREAGTGALTQLSGEEACLGGTAHAVSGCAKDEDIDGAEDLAVSPDGKNVYMTSYSANAVIELQRGAHGAVTPLGSPSACVTTKPIEHPACTTATGIANPLGVAISPDGENVYVSGSGEESEAAFARNGETGALTQLASPYECVTSRLSGCGAGSTGVVGLEGGGYAARRVTVSPDGTNVYVAGQTAGTVVELARAMTPTVSEVSPSTGSEAGNTEVTIKGSGFATGATVSFGGRAALSVTVNSANSITATSPPGSLGSSVDVTVSNSTATSATSAADQYVYVPPGALGGLNVNAYCESLGHDGIGPHGEGPAILRKGSVAGPEYAYENWGCLESDQTVVAIADKGPPPSLNNACAVQHPGVEVYAYPSDPNNAFTWGCYEGSTGESGESGGNNGGGGGGNGNNPGNSSGNSSGQPTARIASTLTPVSPVVTRAVPAPQLARTGNVAPVSGQVLVQLPGTSTFVPLATLQQIPFGTVVNATNGTVSVTTALPSGKTQTGEFFDGEFILTQGRNGLVVAKLTGGNFAVCPTASERSHAARASAAHASGKHVVRKLWANAHGQFSTQGNYAAGAVQGTEWLTADLCEGTLIKVTRDKVAVTDLVNHRHVEVRTGHHFLAKAPRG
jgi:DNA-binding beta-propeller fold protein YncE